MKDRESGSRNMMRGSNLDKVTTEVKDWREGYTGCHPTGHVRLQCPGPEVTFSGS